MARTLKVAVHQFDGEDESLRSALLNIDGLRIVGQWDATCAVPALIAQTRPDALAVLLNGASAPNLLEHTTALGRQFPNLTIIGVGLPSDPALLKLAMKARLSELLDLPVDPEKLLAALQTVAERQAARPSGRLIAVRGTGGGCGATTLAANLGVELAKRESQRVAVVDLDLRFGQVATMFDVSPSFTIAELAQQSEEYDERMLGNALAKHDSGVSVLARPRDPETGNVSLVKVSTILNALLEYYDWVLVDEPGRSDMMARVVQDLADELILVAQLVVPSVRNATQVIAGLTSGFNLDHLRVVLNRVPKKPAILTVEKVAETLKRPVFWQIPEDWEAVSGALNLGVPLALHAPDSRARSAIRGLAARLAGEAPGAAAGKPSVMGWFRDRLKGGS